MSWIWTRENILWTRKFGMNNQHVGNIAVYYVMTMLTGTAYAKEWINSLQHSFIRRNLLYIHSSIRPHWSLSLFPSVFSCPLTRTNDKIRASSRTLVCCNKLEPLPMRPNHCILQSCGGNEKEMRIKGTEALFRRILTTKDVFEAFFPLVLLVSRSPMCCDVCLPAIAS